MPKVRELVFLASSVNDLNLLVEKVEAWFENNKIWTFTGDMGAGKTTLIKSICHHLGVSDNVHSPTFNLVNEYLDAQGNTIYHFDFYRIKHVDEAVDIGFFDYLASDNLCLIEWPNKISALLPEKHIHCKMESQSPTTRKITIEPYG
jgi:tRNA threonylcarbamoyladenosine biosynthesis protein TsaE